MKFLTDVHTVWLRETKKSLADPAHLTLTLFRPLLVIFLIASGLNKFVIIPGNENSYVGFFGPGLVMVMAIALALQVGISLIRDSDGTVKALLVSPLSRGAILTGKILAEFSEQILTLFVALLVVLLVLKISLSGVLLVIPVLGLSVVGFASLGIVSSFIFRSPKSYSAFITFVIGPLMFLSGAIFPVSTLPGWLRFLASINPLTYGVQGVRAALYNGPTSTLPTDLAVLTAFALGFYALAWWIFQRQEVKT